MLAIQYYRLKLGLSQETLASLVKVSQPRICNIETGRLRPSDDLLNRLAVALGVSPAVTLLRPVVVQVQEQVFFQDTDEQVSA